MSDLLESAALIFAVIGMLISIWYPEIKQSLKKELPLTDVNETKKEIRKTLWQKVIPLLVLTILFSVIFFPDVIKFLNQSVSLINQNSPRQYDSVGTAFTFVIPDLLILVSPRQTF
jgi:hypothetical protein